MKTSIEENDLSEVPNPTEVLAPFFRALFVALLGALGFSAVWIGLGNVLLGIAAATAISLCTAATVYLPRQKVIAGWRNTAISVLIMAAIFIPIYLVYLAIVVIASVVYAAPYVTLGIVVFIGIVLLMALASQVTAANTDIENAKTTIEVELAQDANSERWTIHERRATWESSNKKCHSCKAEIPDWRGEHMSLIRVPSGNTSVVLKAICKKCTTQSSSANSKGIASLSEIPPRKKWSKEVRERLWKKYGQRCYYCHEILPSYRGEHMHLDHLIPYSGLGPDEEANLVPACPSCNLEKSDKSFPELI